MTDWLIAYGVGAFVMLALFGATADPEKHPIQVGLFAAALWPIILPVIVGAIIADRKL